MRCGSCSGSEPSARRASSRSWRRWRGRPRSPAAPHSRVARLISDTKTITRVLAQEPPQLDSTRATDQVSIFVLGHIMEGLLRYDASNRLVPGVAERWDLRPDGATFWLRDDARWNDGRPVTAHDFVFAWRTIVDPANASEYAFILYYIRNAEAINAGQMPPEALGVRATSDRVLEVAFERLSGSLTSSSRSPSIFPFAKTST